jgi:subtilase family serine protease
VNSSIRRLTLSAAVVGALALLVAAVAGAGGAAPGRTVLVGSKPSWVGPIAQAGTVPAGQTVSAKVWLGPNNAAALQALAKAVSDPSSSQYRHYLTHSQYVGQFAPTAAQVASVKTWLAGAGLTVKTVGPDNHYLAVTGPASAASAAFGTQLGLFSVNGNQVQAPTSDVSVPSTVQASVLAVSGLTPVGHVVKTADLGAPPGFVNATPCSSYYNQQMATTLPQYRGRTLPYAVCGYKPAQFRGTYGVTGSGLTGAGQTVAITDAFDSSTLLSDANTYATRQGDPAFAGGQFSNRSVPEPQPGDPDYGRVADCGGNGWYGEQTLDVEAVHAMATGANVAYYGARSCYDDDFLAQFANILSDGDASIVTNSWGQPTFVVIGGVLYITIDENLVNAYDSIFEQGDVQGVGFYFSSGDNGDDNAAFGFAHPDFPAGDPWVTAVGGTSLGINSSNSRTFETGWGTSKWALTGSTWTQTIPFQYGAGGGYSEIFQQPWYQNGIVKNNPTGGRAVPDVAMDADPTTGMLIGETQNFALSSVFGPPGVHYGEFRIGGTSLASPLMAGVQAVMQQGLGARFGFANPSLYYLKANEHNSDVFYDPQGGRVPDFGNVRSDYANGYNASNGIIYSLRSFNQDSSLITNQGWDDVTGVGTPSTGYIKLASGK